MELIFGFIPMSRAEQAITICIFLSMAAGFIGGYLTGLRGKS
ncbi:hypothetical protein [Ralstonia phage RP13]|nr:hypothetical protein [Ralstonia phage RP13]